MIARQDHGPLIVQRALAFLSIMLSAVPGVAACESITEAPTG